VLFGRNRESRTREAAGRRNWPEAVPKKMRGRKGWPTELKNGAVSADLCEQANRNKKSSRVTMHKNIARYH
jgi:hypothetical protein